LERDFNGFGKWGNQNKHFWGVFDENQRRKHTERPFSQCGRPVIESQRLATLCLALGTLDRASFYLHFVPGALGAMHMVPKRSFEGVLLLFSLIFLLEHNMLILTLVFIK